MSALKICPICLKEFKPITRQVCCGDACHNIHVAQKQEKYYLKNRLRIIRYGKRYYQAHKQEILNYQKLKYGTLK